MGSRVETNQTTSARAIADIENGELLARVDIPAPPESIFPALASESITRWWVRPGVFDTREWTGDVRPGGAWRAAGVGGRGPYVLEGHFVEIDPPERLVHTWQAAGQAALDHCDLRARASREWNPAHPQTRRLHVRRNLSGDVRGVGNELRASRPARS